MPRRARSSGLGLKPGNDMATRGREPATFLTESLCAETEPPRIPGPHCRRRCGHCRRQRCNRRRRDLLEGDPIES